MSAWFGHWVLLPGSWIGGSRFWIAQALGPPGVVGACVAIAEQYADAADKAVAASMLYDQFWSLMQDVWTGPGIPVLTGVIM